MEVTRHAIFCSVLTVIAIVFLLVKAHDSAPKTGAPPALGQAITATERAKQRNDRAIAQSIKARDDEQARREAQAKHIPVASTATTPAPRPAVSDDFLNRLAAARVIIEVQCSSRRPPSHNFPRRRSSLPKRPR